jgi:hypothetical protein
MRPRPVFIALLALLLPLSQAWSRPPALSLDYSSPERDVTISGGRIAVRSFVYAYDNPASATPSSVRVETNSRPLSPGELSALEASLRTNRFFNLRNAYGAPGRERHYAYALTVATGGRKKTVIFRSNPSWPGADEAFHRIERLVLGLAAGGQDRTGARQ